MKVKTDMKRKRRSGNGTSNVQWLYVLGNFPFLWVVKIGIAGNLWKRERQVDRTAPGWDFVLFALYIPGAYQVEQWLHKICKPLRVSFRGSGHTERFLFPAAIPAVITSLFVFVVSWGGLALLLIAIIKTLPL